ncbi:hypothetical protein ACFQ0T_37295 [Kitasatospora gansuensis]
MIAERTGTDNRTVLLALYAVALHRVTGVGPVVLRPVVNNRFRPGLSEVVCMVAQAGVSVLEIGDGTVDEAVELTRRGTMATHKHAYFHPEQLNELLARVSAERDEAVDVQCFFNDRSTDGPSAEDSPPSGRGCGGRGPRARSGGSAAVRSRPTRSWSVSTTPPAGC